jgi:hypothetical protein
MLQYSGKMRKENCIAVMFFFLMDDPLRLYLSFNHILSSESCDTVCGQLSNK